jgi:hypothetical protein
MSWKGIVVVALSAPLLECGSVKGDIELMCNLSTVCPPIVGDPSRSAFEQATCLEGKIKTERGRKAIESLATVAPRDRPALMRDLAKRAGVASCPEADALQRSLAAP